MLVAPSLNQSLSPFSGFDRDLAGDECFQFCLFDRFMRCQLNATENANGFANRILWLFVRRGEILPEPPLVPRQCTIP